LDLTKGLSIVSASGVWGDFEVETGALRSPGPLGALDGQRKAMILVASLRHASVRGGKLSVRWRKKEQGLFWSYCIGNSLEAPCLNFERSACVFLS